VKRWFLLLIVIGSLSWGFVEIAMAQTGPEYRWVSGSGNSGTRCCWATRGQ